jgi:hypothetical protein
MKYAIEMDSYALTHSKFHKDWFRHSEVDRGIRRHTDSMVISYACFYFFKIWKVC